MKKHTFSVSLEKENGLKNLCIGSEFGPKVEIEGNLGTLEGINFVENAILEIRGSGGILRMDLNREAVERLLKEEKKMSNRIKSSGTEAGSKSTRSWMWSWILHDSCGSNSGRRRRCLCCRCTSACNRKS